MNATEFKDEKPDNNWIYICHGPNEVSVSETKQRLLGLFKKNGFLNKTFDLKDESTHEKIKSFLLNQSLFDEKKCAIIDLNHSIPGKKIQPFLQSLSDCTSEKSRLFLLWRSSDTKYKKTKWFALLTKKARIFEAPILYGKNLSHWLQNRLSELSIQIQPSDLKKVIEATQGDQTQIERLILQCEKSHSKSLVPTSTIDELIEHTTPSRIFHILDTVLMGKLNQLHPLLTKTTFEQQQQLFWMLLKTLRTIRQLKYSNKIRIPDWQARKFTRVLNQWSLRELDELWSRVTQLEYRLKGASPLCFSQGILECLYQLNQKSLYV